MSHRYVKDPRFVAGTRVRYTWNRYSTYLLLEDARAMETYHLDYVYDRFISSYVLSEDDGTVRYMTSESIHDLVIV